jgi:hypothetical protein
MTNEANDMHDALQLDDLAVLALNLRGGGQPLTLFAAVEALTARVIGHRLFTIMAFDPVTYEVERLHTSMPEVYPVGGRKKKAQTAWGEHTLTRMQVFRATTPDGIRNSFHDHRTITDLGLGSILNIPIVYDGRCVGTMNMTHASGWYTAAHERDGLTIGAFLATALMEQRRRS